MKKDTLSLCLLFSLIAQFILLFTPWFSFNIEIMGFYGGFRHFEFFLVQFLFAFYYFRWGKERLWEKLLLELSLFSIPLALYYTSLVWVNAMNIAERIGFKESMHTVLPCYWVSAAVSVISIILCQLLLVTDIIEKRNARRA